MCLNDFLMLLNRLPAAPAERGLEDDGHAVGLAELDGLLGAGDGLVRAGDDGQAGGDGRLARGHLVAHLGHDMRGRPDEGHAAVLARLGEVGPLREEAVARVDCVDPVALGDSAWVDRRSVRSSV